MGHGFLQGHLLGFLQAPLLVIISNFAILLMEKSTFLSMGHGFLQGLLLVSRSNFAMFSKKMARSYHWEMASFRVPCLWPGRFAIFLRKIEHSYQWDMVNFNAPCLWPGRFLLFSWENTHLENKWFSQIIFQNECVSGGWFGFTRPLPGWMGGRGGNCFFINFTIKLDKLYEIVIVSWSFINCYQLYLQKLFKCHDCLITFIWSFMKFYQT